MPSTQIVPVSCHPEGHAEHACMHACSTAAHRHAREMLLFEFTMTCSAEASLPGHILYCVNLYALGMLLMHMPVAWATPACQPTFYVSWMGLCKQA